jgi:iron complex transport system ATP-binding protein
MLVDIKNITCAYQHHIALADVSLTAAAGEIIVCIGPNGAGKSTLIRAIAGTVPLRDGQIMLAGADVATMPAAQRAQHIAVVPQTVVMPAGFTVREVVAMARYAFHPWYQRHTGHDDQIINYAMSQAGVEHFATTPANQLSGGEQQRVAFARAIAQQPKVLLLDETTAHLDLHHQHAIIRCIKELAQCGVLIIAAMHDINLAASFASRICVLQQGHLLADGVPATVLNQAFLEQIYHTPLKVVPQSDHPTPLFFIQH